jgi:acyl-CoA synthetase (AMP-forming)/AMP-acid ligase II
MHELQPRTLALRDPDRPATITDTGEVVTYLELEERSCRLAQAVRDQGIQPGDHVAMLLENTPRFHEVFYGFQRAGVIFTPISTRLSSDEAATIVNDCGARLLVTSTTMGELAASIVELTPKVERRLSIGGSVEDHEDYDEVMARYPAEPLADEVEGSSMTYSSGTTGRPKGADRGLPNLPYGALDQMAVLYAPLEVDEASVFMVPGPLYHAAPMGWSAGIHRLGGTLILMHRFDAERCLEMIEKHRVTHGLFVPTMFVRMLKLPTETRMSFDVSSLKAVVHAAAPCPVEIKREMLDWWGPVIHEFYAGSEGGGITWATPEEWINHPGTVGRSLTAPMHICDDEGRELPPGEVGTIWFSDVPPINYHNAPELSASVLNDKGWVTLWDIGYLDDDGFLYLTDRKQFMIVSGGVNIYPQEVENVLVLHPDVVDVAVFGIPNDDMGEEVKAVVQPKDMGKAGPELETRLIEHCRTRIAHYKCPRSIDFMAELPRADNGKLFKRELRDRYWGERGDSRII